MGAPIPDTFSAAPLGAKYLTNGPEAGLPNEVDITAAGSLTTAKDWTFSASVTLDGAAKLTGDISPAALGASTNDYAPAGFAGANVLRLDMASGGSTLTGLAGGAAGRVVVVLNISGTDDLTLSHLDAGSSGGNQFSLPDDADVVVRRGGSVVLYYDGTSTKWRVAAASATSAAPAATVYVDPAGDDANDGATAGTAVLTLNRAVDLANVQLELGVDEDVVIQLAAGSYVAGNFTFQRAPKKRIVILGPVPDDQEVIESGSLTAGAAALVTDAAAAFGTLRGLTLRVFDPGDQATTEQVATIRRNTATTIEPAQAFFPVPAAGWTYEVLRATAIITPGGAGEDFKFSVPVAPGTAPLNIEPSVFVAWLRVDGVNATSGVGMLLWGGTYQFIGCLVEVASGRGMEANGASVAFGGYTPTVTDPVLGIAAGDFRTSAGLSILSDPALGDAALVKGGFVWSAPVVRGDFYLAHHTGGPVGGRILGGAIHDGRIVVDESSAIEIADGFDASLAFLFVGGFSSGALDVRSNSSVTLLASMFRLTVGSAIRVADGGYVNIDGVPYVQPSAGDIPGNGVDVLRGGTCRATTAITAVNFNATGTDCTADGTTVGAGAWLGAAGVPISSSTSGARVYQV